MRCWKTIVTAAAAACIITPLAAPESAAASVVRVTVTGVVENNMFPNNGTNTFGGLGAGTPVTLKLDVDSSIYLDSVALPGRTRGYNILPGSLTLTIGSVTAPRLETTPAYFCVRNNDPRADGFFLSQGTDIDTEIPLQMTPSGFGIQFLRTFSIDTPFPEPDDSLTSLDILGAVGSWGMNDISSYHFAVGRGEFQLPIIIDYLTITIAVLCPADVDNNGAIEPADIAMFVNTWLGSLSGGGLAGDFDHNNAVEPADIAAFVNAWLQALTSGC